MDISIKPMCNWGLIKIFFSHVLWLIVKLFTLIVGSGCYNQHAYIGSMSLAWALLKSGPFRTQACNRSVQPFKQTNKQTNKLHIWFLRCRYHFKEETFSFNMIPITKILILILGYLLFLLIWRVTFALFEYLNAFPVLSCFRHFSISF